MKVTKVAYDNVPGNWHFETSEQIIAGVAAATGADYCLVDNSNPDSVLFGVRRVAFKDDAQRVMFAELTTNPNSPKPEHRNPPSDLTAATLRVWYGMVRGDVAARLGGTVDSKTLFERLNAAYGCDFKAIFETLQAARAVRVEIQKARTA